MLATLVLFSLLTFGFAFLIADAKIFGCPAKEFVPAYDDAADGPTVFDPGIIPIRQFFLRATFIRELLECYFCLGVWCGILAHLTLLWMAQYNQLILNSYFILSTDGLGIVAGIFTAAVLGGPVCYITDLIVQIAENAVGALEND